MKNKQARRAARQLFRDCLVDGLLDEDRVRQVALRIIESRRRHGLAILSYFQRLIRLDREGRTATIESAAPLPDDLQASVEAGLVSRYGRGLRTAFKQNPALIGGMRIRVGSDVYDGSVRGRLEALETQL
jgi:F-type H+-transporting ATPase subunit delta